MGDLERNVRVSFKLSREAAIKLREIALTESELLCNLGVLAVQLGNESQICISSSLNFDMTGQNGARTGKTNKERTRKRHVETTSVLRESSTVPKVDNNKELLNVDRGVRAVDQVLSRVPPSSETISDSLPPMNTPNKAPFMNKTSTQENGRYAHEIHLKPSPNTSDTTHHLHASWTEGDGSGNNLPMKPISHNGVIKFKAKDVTPSQDAEPHRNALYANKSKREDITCSRNDIQDTITLNMDSVSANASKISAKGKETATGQETDVTQKIHSNTSGQDLPKIPHEFDSDRQGERTESQMDSTTTSIKLNEPDMTDTFECNVNNEINSNIPTFPGHGISFAQHLINLSKQYRLENEKSPSGLSNEKFFISDASRIVRNDHVLRSFTAANEKQEDFMGFTGQNALLFDGNYTTTAVKSAEELSKEQSEASPTNRDSMSEASADSLFEEARLGSVDELSLSPSSNENVPISGEENSRRMSPAPTENTKSDNQHFQIKQEKHRRKKYQRHLKGHSGIVCKLCMHAVQKSYSCYKLAQAPKEIRHLFDDGSHCVRVCRRCLPYKSPKTSEKNSQKKLHKTIEKLLK